MKKALFFALWMAAGITVVVVYDLFFSGHVNNPKKAVVATEPSPKPALPVAVTPVVVEKPVVAKTTPAQEANMKIISALVKAAEHGTSVKVLIKGEDYEIDWKSGDAATECEKNEYQIKHDEYLKNLPAERADLLFGYTGKRLAEAQEKISKLEAEKTVVKPPVMVAAAKAPEPDVLRAKEIQERKKLLEDLDKAQKRLSIYDPELAIQRHWSNEAGKYWYYNPQTGRKSWANDDQLWSAQPSGK